MKTTIIVLAVCMLAVSGFSADEPSPSPSSAESLIASLPTQIENDRWKSMSIEERKTEMDGKLGEKRRAAPKNCKQLQALITVGKAVSDYPGLLTLGIITWDKDQHTYHLRVTAPLQRGEGDYGGFLLTFDQSMIITQISTATWVC